MPRHYQPEGSFLMLPITSSTHTNLRRFPTQQSSCRRRDGNISARCRTRTHKAVTPNGFQIRALIQPDTEHIRFPQQNTSQIEWEDDSAISPSAEPSTRKQREGRTFWCRDTGGRILYWENFSIVSSTTVPCQFISRRDLSRWHWRRKEYE